jgi:hypothetical protein
VKCSDSIFFDVSDADFTIGASAGKSAAARFGGALTPLLLLGLVLIGRRRRG